MTRFAALIAFALFFCGCSSYVGQLEPGRDLKATRLFFVKSNFHDNRGIDGRIARWLEAQGYRAETGPMTMMPPQAEVLITYDDHWNWDFTTHLTWMRISLADARSEKPLGSATFSSAASLTVSLDKVIDRLMRKLLVEEEEKKQG